MSLNWDLSVFYASAEDDAFVSDLAALPERIRAFDAEVSACSAPDAAALESLTLQLEDVLMRMDRLFCMVEMTLAANTEDEAANRAETPLMQCSKQLSQSLSGFARLLSRCEGLPETIESSDILRSRAFFLLEAAQSVRHKLPEVLEGPILAMQLSGGEAFSKLRDKLDATLLVDLPKEQLPLSAVRAMAYDADPAVRRTAYEAELAAYKKIELPMASCLNSIKAEGQTIAALRGYSDILEMTLDESRMDRRALDAMWTAIGEALPELRRYLKAKARLLGHPDGLPFYDLFAPVGSNSRSYTIEEAQQLLLRVFGAFTPKMSDMMREAFENDWIDYLPRPGKSGGAFCEGFYQSDISRILTNFTGSYSDVSTLAHELGHAFNNRMLRRKPRLMIDTPLPLAETASTFNEILLAHTMRADASPEEELGLLDAALTENVQTLVDIYSRYLFETDVAAAQATHAPSPAELCDMMRAAQQRTYGDGLDQNVLHPYMWACKCHYYSTGFHFYNFPYAFGCLFGHGLFEQYLKQGASFVPTYCDLLSRFGSGRISDVTASVGIDILTPDFWREAVASVLKDVDRFCELAQNG